MISNVFSRIKSFLSKHWKQFLLILAGVFCAIIVFYLIVLITGWI